jgi:uncharacterized protein (TIGR02444 family)
MTGGELWPYALEVYARPGVEAALLELQDDHGQCVAYLLWSLWLARQGRPADPATLASGADLARAWQEAAVAPLRHLRRDLKHPSRSAPAGAWDGLRRKVKALELDAERMLLQMLEAAAPPPAGAPLDPCERLRAAVTAWGGAAPAHLLDRLVRAAA